MFSSNRTLRVLVTVRRINKEFYLRKIPWFSGTASNHRDEKRRSQGSLFAALCTQTYPVEWKSLMTSLWLGSDDHERRCVEEYDRLEWRAMKVCSCVLYRERVVVSLFPAVKTKSDS